MTDTESSPDQIRPVGSDINAFLRDMRALSGWSQGQLGDELGVTQQTMASWENDNQISTKNKELIVSFFGLTPAESAMLNDGVEIRTEPFERKRPSRVKGEQRAKAIGAFLTRIENGPPLTDSEADIFRDLIVLPKRSK